MEAADSYLRHRKNLLEIDEAHCNPSTILVQLPQTAKNKKDCTVKTGERERGYTWIHTNVPCHRKCIKDLHHVEVSYTKHNLWISSKFYWHFSEKFWMWNPRTWPITALSSMFSLLAKSQSNQLAKPVTRFNTHTWAFRSEIIHQNELLYAI